MTTDATGHFALFLDFDGTLVEIAPTPEAVQVDPELGPTLTRLREALGGALALVTGRPVATIDRFLAPYRFDVGGLHGVEHRSGDVIAGCVPEQHPDLRKAVTLLGQMVAGGEGLLIEDKGCSVAVHWRLAPSEVAAATEAFVERVAQDLSPRYRLQRGKAVAEILPATASKGHAIRAFLKSGPYDGRSAIFFGDDLTDEEAFTTVNADGGLTVRVGSGATVAQRRVASPADVRAVLARWAEAGSIDRSLLPQALS